MARRGADWSTLCAKARRRPRPNVSDAAALTKAFSGADAAYLMLPPVSSREDQERQSDAIAKAVKESGLRYAVNLSSCGRMFPKAPGQSRGCILRSKN